MKLPPEQEAIRAKCFHPSRQFVEFTKEQIEQSIAMRFREIAHRYPVRLAAKMNDHELCYDKLNRLTNRLARAIVNRCGPGNSMVVVLIEQGLDLIVGILGTLKAGKCFVLADVSWPTTRLAEVIKDSNAELIVTTNHAESKVRAICENLDTFLNINQLNNSISDSDAQIDASADSLGFLLYTSGSSGKPKGVLQNQRNSLHGVMRRINGFKIEPDDRLTLLSSGGHQAIMNILSALLCGASVFPFDPKQHNTTEFSEWIEREGITIYHSSASLFRQLVSTLSGKENLSRVRLVRSASEATVESDFGLYKEHFPDDSVFCNGMGSTETGTSTLFFMDKRSSIDLQSVPIGYPLEDMYIQTVDEERREVERGFPGEIVVASPYLALGYWGQPELTEAKFCPDPQDPSKRRYFTGDSGLIRDDGCLVFSGRKDGRIKIRGFGVDLAQVEKTLRQNPAVSEAVVVDCPSSVGEPRLVGYFTSPTPQVPTSKELRDYLGKSLPSYMVPTKFVRMDTLPLTTNGKIDRKALPEPDRKRPELSTPYAEAQNGKESTLVQIWEQILEIHPIGIHDNFFDLAGHSLAAMRVVSRVITEFQLEIPLQSLFQSPTIADMATVIAAHQGKALDEQGLAAMLNELESMSDGDAEQLLGKQHHDDSKA